MDIKKRTFRDEHFTGYSNQDIKSLEKQICDINDLKKKLEKEIEEIRENCEHIFLFSSRGQYEDCYTCSLCGEDIWK